MLSPIIVSFFMIILFSVCTPQYMRIDKVKSLKDRDLAMFEVGMSRVGKIREHFVN